MKVLVGVCLCIFISVVTISQPVNAQETGDVHIETNQNGDVVVIVDLNPVDEKTDFVHSCVPTSPPGKFTQDLFGATITYEGDRLTVEQSSSGYYFDCATYAHQDQPPSWATIVQIFRSAPALYRGDWGNEEPTRYTIGNLDLLGYQVLTNCGADPSCDSGGTGALTCTVTGCPGAPTGCGAGCGTGFACCECYSYQAGAISIQKARCRCCT